MNKEGASDKKESDQREDGSKEQPHMRVEAKAAAERKSMYKERYLSLKVNLYFVRLFSLIFADPSNYTMYHEICSEKELHSVKITHKKFESWHDRVAYAAVRTLRFFFDTFTGYIHAAPRSKSEKKNHIHRAQKNMTEKLWLRRIIFLESIVGVPGMVAGMSRHMKSLRK
jgi:hypothetical protein